MNKILVTGDLDVLSIAINEYGADRVWWKTSPINERKGIRAGMVRGNLLALDSNIDEKDFVVILSNTPNWLDTRAALKEGAFDEQE